MTDDALRTILAALPGVDSGQVEISSDGSMVTVNLCADQVEEVYRENGRQIREAAISTGIRIDIQFPEDCPPPFLRPPRQAT